MPIKLQHFYMIRHGETEANAARLMAGSLDSPLTDKGRTQAAQTQTIIQSLQIKPRAIIHSQLSRARDTAQILNANLNLPMSQNPDLAEWHAGDWEGETYEKCRNLLIDWITPPNGETPEQFLKRTKDGINGALGKQNQPVMIVCHGGVFRAFCKFYDLESQGVENCILYEFKPDPTKTQFPWDIYEHRPSNDPVRKKVMIYSAPTSSDSEIA